MASRKKKLERHGLEKDEHGHKLKVSYSGGVRQFSATRAAGGAYTKAGTSNGSVVSVLDIKNNKFKQGQEVSQTVDMAKDVFRVAFASPTDLGSAQHEPLVEFRHVSFGYDADTLLVRDSSFSVGAGRRVLILGPNGAGKSTVLKLITGEAAALRGEVKLNRAAKLDSFSQHHADALPPGLTPVQHMQSLFPDAKESTLRSTLRSFGILKDQCALLIGQLSGGQKTRLAFSVLTHGAPHLLLLDEPSNHLDMRTTDLLAEALQTFEGAMVLVTHNRALISAIGTPDALWLMRGDGNLEELPVDRLAKLLRY